MCSFPEFFFCPYDNWGCKKNTGFGRVISYLNSGNDPYGKIYLRKLVISGAPFPLLTTKGSKLLRQLPIFGSPLL